MKKTIITFALLSFAGLSQAQYVFKMPLEQQAGGALPDGSIKIQKGIPKPNWVATDPAYSEWSSQGSIFGCTNWTPSTDTVVFGTNFTQTATDCSINQNRTKQDQEKDTVSLSIRSVGSPITESQTLSGQSSSRSATGSLHDTWASITPMYTGWTNQGSIFGCTNWTPNPSTVLYDTDFTQTANDCSYNQVRSKQNREQETTTLVIRNVGEAINENQILANQSSTRTAKGTFHNTWIATTPEYTAWVNSGAVYGCSWTPATSTKPAGTSFTQTASDCKQDMTSSKQNKEQEQFTKEIRNAGVATTETKTTSNVSSSQTAIGTLEELGCRYDLGDAKQYWYDSYPTSAFYWGSTVQFFSYSNQYILDGYRYTKGSLTFSNESGNLYYVCKAKI